MVLRTPEKKCNSPTTLRTIAHNRSLVRVTIARVGGGGGSWRERPPEKGGRGRLRRCLKIYVRVSTRGNSAPTARPTRCPPPLSLCLLFLLLHFTPVIAIARDDITPTTLIDALPKSNRLFLSLLPPPPQLPRCVNCGTCVETSFLAQQQPINCLALKGPISMSFRVGCFTFFVVVMALRFSPRTLRLRTSGPVPHHTMSPLKFSCQMYHLARFFHFPTTSPASCVPHSDASPTPLSSPIICSCRTIVLAAEAAYKCILPAPTKQNTCNAIYSNIYISTLSMIATAVYRRWFNLPCIRIIFMGVFFNNNVVGHCSPNIYVHLMWCTTLRTPGLFVIVLPVLSMPCVINSMFFCCCHDPSPHPREGG